MSQSDPFTLTFTIAPAGGGDPPPPPPPPDPGPVVVPPRSETVGQVLTGCVAEIPEFQACIPITTPIKVVPEPPGPITIVPDPGYLVPFGCMCLFAADEPIDGTEACWTNDAVKGVRLRARWSEVEPSEGNFQWGFYDAAAAAAEANGKQWGLSIAGGLSTPGWVIDLGPQMLSMSFGDMPLPWDPIALAKWLNFVEAFGERYNGKVTYVPMAGYSRVATTEWLTDAADIPLIDSFGGLPAWENCVDIVTAKYDEVFPNASIIIVSSGPPYPNTDGGDAMRSVVNRNLALYPHMGPMHTALNSDTSGAPSTWRFIKDNPLHPNVVQFVTNTQGFGGLTLHGTVAEVLARGIELGAHAIEVYKIDADNPIYHDDMVAANILMPQY